MDASTSLLDTAVAVVVSRYRLTEEDAMDMLSVSSHITGTSLNDLGSWLVYDAEGNYYPLPGPDASNV